MRATGDDRDSLWSDGAVAAILQCGTEGRWKHRLALGKPEGEEGWREVKPDTVCKAFGGC